MPPTPISGQDTGDAISRQPKPTNDEVTMAGKKHHPYSHHETHHFKDGSGHTHLHHESDPKKDVEFAHLDHDQMMDGLQQHLGGGAGEPAEEAMEAGAGGGGMAGAV
jgi:hypothetical protein